MKKLFLILVLGLILDTNSFLKTEPFCTLEDQKRNADHCPIICTFEDIKSNAKKCETFKPLQDTLKKSVSNPFYKYLHPGLTEDEFRQLLRDKMAARPKEERDNYWKISEMPTEETEEQKKEREKQIRAETEFECSTISGSANNYFSARKIYASCMKKYGY